MSYNHLPLESPLPGHENDPGVHYVDLHFWGRTGLLHQSVEAGDRNPLDYPIGRVSMGVLKQADGQNGDHNPPAADPSRLVGMTVYRVGIHEFETEQHNIDHQLVATKLGNLAFVKKLGIYRPVEYIDGARVSQYGVARMQVDGSWTAYVQHLEATEEEQARPVRFATPSLAAHGRRNGIWIGLRPKSRSVTKQRNSFVERFVDLEELNDTRK